MKKSKKPIPAGFYCYTRKNKKIIPCPYWSSRKDKPEQENGYCAYLEKGDWQLNKEKRWRKIYTKNGKEIKGKYKSAEEIGISMSLLWDSVKECHINEEFEAGND